jgi:putative IMPACT (imprinted ancient) family translation regulator
VLVVVVRYFGGIKLGIPGLINAYRTAAKDAIDANIIIEKTIDETYRLLFDFSEMNAVMKVLKNDSIKISDQTYLDKYMITFTVCRSEADKFLSSLRKILNVKIEFVK